ncbi:hypothetical protein GQ54DRAFT_262652 [Martensiomyces pterosporus]|nr:hypothetical protein GQ54DRAFT_262652 [Martensiomyces pterosporus]
MNDQEFAQAIEKRYDTVNQYLYYGRGVAPNIVSVDVKKREMTAEWLVTSDYISPQGCIDEGCLGTVTDNTTAMLIGAVLPNGKSVSTSISIQGVSPIKPGTTVEISCKLSSRSTKQPHASAIFRDKHDHSVVYGIGSHTKFFKSGLVETQPKM